MAQQSSENKKMDFSSLPRGAIGIRGLPVNRNTRLPSIRSPRDLTLGTAPKRTFMPNIPVRREKKLQVTPSVSQVKQEIIKPEVKNTTSASERGRGRGRNNKVIIQTHSSIFADGVAGEVFRKDKRTRESYSKSDYSAPTKGLTIKKEIEDRDITGISSEIENLFRDDFIDDGDDYECDALKPIIFPAIASIKKESKSEVKDPAVNFDPDIAKEMDFDVNRVAKFIKKEKTETKEEIKAVVSPELPPNDINNLLNTDSESPKLVLLKLPQFLNMSHKMDESDSSQRRSTTSDIKSQENQDESLLSVKSLPEGHIGKLQIMKSGKTRLLIGPIEYTLDSSCSMRNSKHELVSVTTNSSTGDLCVLGCVNDILNFVPNDTHLLGQC